MPSLRLGQAFGCMLLLLAVLLLGRPALAQLGTTGLSSGGIGLSYSGASALPPRLTVSVNLSSVTGGQPLQITWATLNAPPETAVQLLLADATTGFAVERISDMTGSPLSGSMNWTVPTQLTGNYVVQATLYSRNDTNCTVPDAVSSTFHVSGNQLQNPDNSAFGPLVGVIDINSISHLDKLVSDMRAYGINEIRVPTSPGVGLNSNTLLTNLDAVVAAVTNAGDVVILDNNSGSYYENVMYLKFLANRYKSNPLVWLTPKNETDCDTSRDRQLPNLDDTFCDNLSHWQTTAAGYVNAIRSTGFINPIVVHVPGYFAINLAEVLSPNILPADSNLILAVHAYPFGPNVRGCCQVAASDPDFTTTASSTLENSFWANYANTYPVFLDEAGTWYVTQNWETGFLPFVKDWVQNRGGLGIAAFFWRGSAPADPNSQMMQDNGTLTLWGSTVNTNIFTTLGAVPHPVGAITPPPPISCTFPDATTTLATATTPSVAISDPGSAVAPRCTIYAYSGATITGNQLSVPVNTAFSLGYTNVGHPTAATLTRNGVDTGLSLTLPNAAITVTSPASAATYTYALNPSNGTGSSSCSAVVTVTP